MPPKKADAIKKNDEAVEGEVAAQLLKNYVYFCR
jgi:hypothetical protein